MRETIFIKLKNRLATKSFNQLWNWTNFFNWKCAFRLKYEREKNKCAESIKGKQMGISRSFSSSSFAAIIYSLRAETQLQASAVRTNCRHSSNNWRKKQAKRHWHFAASFSAEDRAGDWKAGRNRNSSLSVHRKIEKSVMATGKASAQKGTANVRKQSQQKQKPSSVETYKTNVPQCANRKKC